ncbi:hypothetical protein C2W62_30320 [Candidatus Entotheonella serta]|nr:hypothetical protein C2W62_30320 [Candidatus Entotheonella serta]
MKACTYSMPEACSETSSRVETVQVEVAAMHPLLLLKQALPWEAITETMTRHWRECGKNVDGGPGLLGMCRYMCPYWYSKGNGLGRLSRQSGSRFAASGVRPKGVIGTLKSDRYQQAQRATLAHAEDGRAEVYLVIQFEQIDARCRGLDQVGNWEMRWNWNRNEGKRVREQKGWRSR